MKFEKDLLLCACYCFLCVFSVYLIYFYKWKLLPIFLLSYCEIYLSETEKGSRKKTRTGLNVICLTVVWPCTCHIDVKKAYQKSKLQHFA